MPILNNRHNKYTQQISIRLTFEFVSVVTITLLVQLSLRQDPASAVHRSYNIIKPIQH